MTKAMQTRVLNKLRASPKGRYATTSMAETEAARALIERGDAILKDSYYVTSFSPRRHEYRAMYLQLPEAP